MTKVHSSGGFPFWFFVSLSKKRQTTVHLSKPVSPIHTRAFPDALTSQHNKAELALISLASPTDTTIFSVYSSNTSNCPQH